MSTLCPAARNSFDHRLAVARFPESESGGETDSSDGTDNRKRKRDQNFNDDIGTVKHREKMAHGGIDFVLYEVILAVSNMLEVVRKRDGETSGLGGQMKDRVLSRAPRKRKRTQKSLRFEKSQFDQGMSNFRKLGR